MSGNLTSRLATYFLVFFSSRRRHTRFDCDWSSDVCSSDLSLHDLGQKLSRLRDRAGELPPHSAAVEELHLDDAGRLLEYEDLLVGVQEVEDEIRRQRVGLHDMVKGDAVPQAGLREDLPGVGRRDAGSHYRPRAGGVRGRPGRGGPRPAGGGGGLFGGPPVQLVAERGSGGPAGGGVPGGGPPGERGG